MLRWLYPNTCERCGEPCQSTICPDCLAALERVPRPICLYCGAPTYGRAQQAGRCDACKAFPRSYDFARSALLRTPESMELVHTLKYGRANHLAVSLAPLLSEMWESTPELKAHDDWCLVPVPVTRTRLFLRGFNQAEELARPLAHLRGLRLQQPLLRVPTENATQTRLSARERRLNAQKAYRLHPAWAAGRKTAAAHLLLVDDVYTTGATTRACAALLRQLPGVSKIGVLTLLRAE